MTRYAVRKKMRSAERTHQYTVGPINRALAAAGAGIRSFGEGVATKIEYATSGYGGTLGNVVAGAGGYGAQMWRTGANLGASIVDVPRTFEGALEDVRQTVRTGQQHGFATGAARQVGLLAGAEAYYGTDVMTHQEVDPWSKAAEASGRIGATAGTAAGIGNFLSPKLPIAPSSNASYSGVTFRGDTRAPSQIFQEGFVPRGAGTNLRDYAQSNSPSIYVGTSRSGYVAADFAGEGGYVYTTRVNAGINVNSALGKASPFPGEVEIVAPGGIRPADIHGAWQVNGGQKTLYIPNPAFKK